MLQPQPDHLQLHALIEGRVQGVGFRYFVLQNAMQLGLTGWVRNTWDDKVEVCVEGSRLDLDKLAGLLRTGPGSAHVTAVKADWQPASGCFSSFMVLSDS